MARRTVMPASSICAAMTSAVSRRHSSSIETSSNG
jgi:hypothetical protein